MTTGRMMPSGLIIQHTGYRLNDSNEDVNMKFRAQGVFLELRSKPKYLQDK